MGKSNRVVSIFCALVATAAFVAAGCGGGAECGEGTIEVDGECVLDGEQPCPAGTIEEDGECVADTGGTTNAGGPTNGGELECPAGTQEQNGVCVADNGPGGLTCGPGTTEEDGECVAATPSCAEGQVLKDGVCIDEVTCGPNTAPDEEGRCVALEGIECLSPNELDPNTNQCVVTDAVCGANTAFHAEDGVCVPTDEVCQEGTYFNDESGLCYPEAQCQPGDVVLDGYCSSELAALIAEADLVSKGITNPGVATPPSLPLADMGERTSFTGTITEPEDIDGDGNPDQVIDWYRIEADPGDWIEITVTSTGNFDPAFQVLAADFNPDSYLRFSPLGLGSKVDRQLALPGGEYFLLVLPQSGMVFDQAPLGSDDWEYYGTVERISRPDAVAHDFEAENLFGSLGSLSENFFFTDFYEPGELVQITWENTPISALERLQVWSSPTDELGTFDEGTFELEVPESGELYFVADWLWKVGAGEHPYEFSVELTSFLEDGETLEETFDALEGDGVRVQVSHNSESDVHVDVAVVTSTGDIVAEASVMPGGEMTQFDLAAGEYTVEFTNTTGEQIRGFRYAIDVASPEQINAFEGEPRDLVIIAQINEDEANIYVDVVHDDSEDLVLRTRISDEGIATLNLEVGGEHTVYHYDFDDVSGLLTDVQLFGAVTVDTFTVESEDAGKVFEISHGHEEGLLLAVYRQNETELFNQGFLLAEDHGMAMIGLLEATYSVVHYDLTEDGMNLGEEFEIDLAVVTPTEVEVSEMIDGTIFEGTANERVVGQHDFYRVQVGTEDPQAFVMTLEQTDGFGFGRLGIYSLNHDNQMISGEETFGEGETIEVEFEFTPFVEYIVRVGNYYARDGWDYDFDYELSFQEQ